MGIKTRLQIKVWLLFLALLSCTKNIDDKDRDESFYKDEMRKFVIEIATYSRTYNTHFIVIPQNGQELVTADGSENGAVANDYLAAINGIGREDLYYGYDNDNEKTPSDETVYMTKYLDIANNNNIRILVTDYCSDPGKMDDSYNKNNSKGYLSFAADHRDLDNIPSYPTVPYNENTDTIDHLDKARNFLYILDPSTFNTKKTYINAVKATNYDVLITDYFFEENEEIVEYDSLEITQLKQKANGGQRLLIAYMSIGEAENYRYYWHPSWNIDPPFFIAAENTDWQGNYKVYYWNHDWKSIIYGNDSSYLKKIVDKGFDGVYLDIIDAFEFYE
jgi:cysteinyl-tRNA synthetase